MIFDELDIASSFNENFKSAERVESKLNSAVAIKANGQSSVFRHKDTTSS